MACKVEQRQRRLTGMLHEYISHHEREISVQPRLELAD